MVAQDVTSGRRHPDVPDVRQPHSWMEPGGYRRVLYPTGWTWEAMTPNGLLGNLAQHDVVEHDDGTITVSPSILVDAPRESSWHGYLERGVWREV